LKNP